MPVRQRCVPRVSLVECAGEGAGLRYRGRSRWAAAAAVAVIRADVYGIWSEEKFVADIERAVTDVSSDDGRSVRRGPVLNAVDIFNVEQISTLWFRMALC